MAISSELQFGAQGSSNHELKILVDKNDRQIITII